MNVRRVIKKAFVKNGPFFILFIGAETNLVCFLMLGGYFIGHDITGRSESERSMRNFGGLESLKTNLLSKTGFFCFCLLACGNELGLSCGLLGGY